MNIVGNCQLCDDHNLHVISSEEDKLMQCLSCGYASSDKFIGTIETNIEYKKLPDDMKNWAIQSNNSEDFEKRIWIPGIMTLPTGVIYPIDVDNMVNHTTEMKWGYAKIIKISDDERKHYPIDNDDVNKQYYEHRYDTENTKTYSTFGECLKMLEEETIKTSKPKETKIKLPKLKKV